MKKLIGKIAYLIFFVTVLMLGIGLFSACKEAERTPIGEDPVTQIERYTVSYQAGEGGRVEGLLQQTIAERGNAAPVEALPDEGYVFVGWSDGNTSGWRRELDVREDISVTALFAKRQFTVTYRAGEGGTVEGESSQTVFWGDETSVVIAVPAEGYFFTGWSDGQTNAIRKDTDVREGIGVTAFFARRQLTVTYQAGDGGTIEGESSQTVFWGEPSRAVTAVPEEGYRFVGWSDGEMSAQRQEPEIEDDFSVTALFEKQEYSVRYEAGEGGSLEGQTEQTVRWEESASTVTAIPAEGYEFAEWSDGVTTAERTDIVKGNLSVTAIFRVRVFTVTYTMSSGGEVVGETVQKVEWGKDCTPVKAVVTEEGYEFQGWGVTNSAGYHYEAFGEEVDTLERHDTNIREDIRVCAFFGLKRIRINCISVGPGRIYEIGEYITGGVDVIGYYVESSGILEARPNEGCAFVRWSDGVTTARHPEWILTEDLRLIAYFGYGAEYRVDERGGGELVGDTSQAVLEGEDFTQVTAVPKEGYVFAGWSDGNPEATRQDLAAQKSLDLIAYFEPIQKMFRYDYGFATGMPLQTEVVLDRNAIRDTVFVLPEMEGYTFDGWYADQEYRLKVVDEDGIYMLGYYGFALESDVLYARWIRNGEEDNLHKILLLVTDEVQATLYSTRSEQDETFEHRLSSIEREIDAAIAQKMADVLNEWFTGIARFEVDLYFTTVPITEDSFDSDIASENSVNANNVPEAVPLLGKYHNILTMLSVGEKYGHIGYSAGLAALKYGCIFMDVNLKVNTLNNITLLNILSGFYEKNEYEGFAMALVETCLHEYAHTVEYVYDESELQLSYHEFNSALGAGNREQCLEATRKYLLREEVIDGKQVGIPMEYWQHENLVQLNYMLRPVDQKYIGQIYLIELDRPGGYLKVPYGSSITVEAIPDEGYAFLQWSDGVTTAVRHDENLISYLEVEAIFVAKAL